MHQDVLEYLKTQKVCVLAVEMPDGSPHAATVHFAHTEEPLVFIFMTNPAYRKYEALANGAARASLVIGTNEGDMRTFQLDGEACLSDNKEYQELYFQKFPKAVHMFKKDALLTFSPTWWRFTDWTKPDGKAVYTSDGDITL